MWKVIRAILPRSWFPEPPPRVQWASWEATPSDKAYNNPPNAMGHTGVFAHHYEDCRCSSGGHNCNPAGSIWSCCGQLVEDVPCTSTPASRA